jgi:hypothetical protein
MPQDTRFARPGASYSPTRVPGRMPSAGRGTPDRTYDELYEKAKRHNIKGRSKMSKTELERALGGR